MTSTAIQRPPKPTVLAVNLDAIPRELRERDQGVLWRYVWRDENGKGEWAKIPFTPGGKEARANDPRTWRAFSVVSAYYQAKRDLWSGIGYEFSADDPFGGIDLDGCRRDDGSFLPWSAETRAKFASRSVPDPIDIIKRLNTYCEVSPSGHGVKLIGICQLPGNRNRLGNKESGIEVYDRGRYFTLTGQRVPGTPATINDCSEAFTELYLSIFGKGKKSGAKSNGKPHSKSKVHSAGKVPTDDEVWDKIAGAKNAEKIIALKGGDISDYASDSEADSGLAFHLAFWTRDAGQIERLMRTSQLVREKWDREDYLGRTIGKALEKVTEFFDWDQIPPLSSAAGRTEVANGRRLVKMHGGVIRWCDVWKKWLEWDQKQWAKDDRCVLDRYAKTVYQSLWDEISEYSKYIGALTGEEEIKKGKKILADMMGFARSTGGARGIEAMIRLARSEPGIPIPLKVLDADPMLLNCDNGTVELRTGKMRPHQREDYLTKISSIKYVPDAPCPLWLKFLDRIFEGRTQLIDFIQRLVGYFLTGDISEQILPVFWGKGANGKNTMLKPITDILADHAMWAAPDLLMVKKFPQHSTERMDLFGKRLVVASEPEAGCRLAEGLVKQLTGGDMIRGRHVYEDNWEFEPTHKVVLVTNHKPRIVGTDYAIWRRVRLVPFTVRIPEHERDKHFGDKLKTEYEGILAWSIRGSLSWQRDGLGEPVEVTVATKEYRDDEDRVADFIVNRCVTQPTTNVKAASLYAGYKAYTEAAREFVMSQRAFGEALTERGYERYTNNGIWYRGIGLLTEGTE